MTRVPSEQNVRKTRPLMKYHIHILRNALACFALVSCVSYAQQEPIIGVDITNIVVDSGTPAIAKVKITSGGSGYTATPTVTVVGGGGDGANLEAIVDSGVVVGLNILTGGAGYTSYPAIVISAPGKPAVASAVVSVSGLVDSITVAQGGGFYSSPPKVTIQGDGSGARATAILTNGTVTSIAVDAKGSGYTSATVIVDPPVSAAATAIVESLGDVFPDPIQNESFGEVRRKMFISARAYGTFGTYNYSFFVNGVLLGVATAGWKEDASISWAPPQPGSYQIKVTATDGLHTATSLSVRYFATGTAVIGPVDNMLVPVGSSVVLQATAMTQPSAPNAFAQRMDFYVDGALVGSDSTYPYSFIYTPSAAPASHVIEARAFDNNGNQISPNGFAQRMLQMVTPIGSPPVVRFVNPPDGGNVPAGTPVTLSVDAIAPDGFIRNVDFYVNGVLFSSAQKFPFTASWTADVPGKYQFVAIASDDKSNAVSSMPITLNAVGSYPTASILSPERGGLSVVQGSILPVRVAAAGPDGGLVSLKTIEFLVDGVVNDSLPKQPNASALNQEPAVLTPPFVFNWKSNVVLGTHKLSVRVTGVGNLAVTTAELAVNVVVNQPPRVTISSPGAQSSVIMNSRTTLVADPTDVDGTIDTVEFFVNGASIGSSTKSPFQISWTPSASGEVELTAKATDNGGATAFSPVVTVNVDPPASTGSNQTTVAYSAYRGDYGSVSENGRFAFAVSRNNKGTFIGYSVSPSGRTYIWTDIPLNPDGTFSIRDADNQIALNGQASATGVSGTMNGKTFIGPVTPSGGAFTPLMVSGSLTGVANSRAVAIVGGDGSVTVYTANGTSREVGTGMLGATGTFGFTAATGGRFAGTVANSASIVSGTASGSVSGSFLLRLQASRLSNISTRTLAGSGDRTLVAGFVVAGSGTKPLLIRAVGPTLANFGVTNALADPDVSVLSRTATLVASNADWGNSASLAALATQVGAFPLTPGSRDAAVQFSASTGAYTAVVGGGTAAPGAALVEIYDTETSSSFTSRISNISTRGQIAAGDTLIAGFVVAGDVRKKVLIRAVGPTLASFGLTGVLADPKIDVFADGTLIAGNNDWTERAVASQVTAVSSAVGAFPLAANGKDAATVLQLPPGSYTVQVSGVGTSAGTVLVEIYDADP